MRTASFHLQVLTSLTILTILTISTILTSGLKADTTTDTVEHSLDSSHAVSRLAAVEALGDKKKVNF